MNHIPKFQNTFPIYRIFFSLWLWLLLLNMISSHIVYVIHLGCFHLAVLLIRSIKRILLDLAKLIAHGICGSSQLRVTMCEGTVWFVSANSYTKRLMITIIKKCAWVLPVCSKFLHLAVLKLLWLCPLPCDYFL